MSDVLPDEVIAMANDFARLFDPDEFLSIVNGQDEVGAVLRAHLVLEEFLTFWTEQVTRAPTIYTQGFIPFGTKVQIARNLGLSPEYADLLNRINDLRNRFAHRRGYKIQAGDVEALAERIDKLKTDQSFSGCREFKVQLSGEVREITGGVARLTGEKQDITHTFASADNRLRFIIVFVVLLLKLSDWLETDLAKRGITFFMMMKAAKRPHGSVPPAGSPAADIT